MAGPNTTGKPNTADYVLGRGKVYFSSLVAGLPDDYRDLGNAPEFNVTVEVETVEHTSSREGLRSVDKEVVISQKVTLTLTLDEVNHENLALFFSGTQGTFTNIANAGFAATEQSDGVELGRWYELADGSGNRAYGISAAAITLEDTGADGMQAPATLVLNTDYEVNEELGMVLILSTGALDAGDHFDVTLAANAAVSATGDEVKALTQSAVTGALKFESINPSDNDAVTEYQFHQVSLKAEGDFSLISDEFTQMQLTGTAEKNETADADSPTLTIRNKRLV